MKKIIFIILFFVFFIFVIKFVFYGKVERKYFVSIENEQNVLITLRYNHNKVIEAALINLLKLKLKNAYIRFIFKYIAKVVIPKNIDLFIAPGKGSFYYLGYFGFNKFIFLDKVLSKLFKMELFSKQMNIAYVADKEFINKKEKYVLKLMEDTVLINKGFMDVKIQENNKLSSDSKNTELTLLNKNNFLTILINKLSKENEYDFFPSINEISKINFVILEKNKKNYLNVKFEEKNSSYKNSEKIKNDLNFILMFLNKILQSANIELKKIDEMKDGIEYEIIA